MENRLREHREKLHLTQKQLAEKAGIGQATISETERGKYTPGVDVALMLAEALGCSVEDLFSLRKEGERVGH